MLTKNAHKLVASVMVTQLWTVVVHAAKYGISQFQNRTRTSRPRHRPLRSRTALRKTNVRHRDDHYKTQSVMSHHLITITQRSFAMHAHQNKPFPCIFLHDDRVARVGGDSATGRPITMSHFIIAGRQRKRLTSPHVGRKKGRSLFLVEASWS